MKLKRLFILVIALGATHIFICRAINEFTDVFYAYNICAAAPETQKRLMQNIVNEVNKLQIGKKQQEQRFLPDVSLNNEIANLDAVSKIKNDDKSKNVIFFPVMRSGGRALEVCDEKLYETLQGLSNNFIIIIVQASNLYPWSSIYRIEHITTSQLEGAIVRSGVNLDEKPEEEKNIALAFSWDYSTLQLSRNFSEGIGVLSDMLATIRNWVPNPQSLEAKKHIESAARPMSAAKSHYQAATPYPSGQAAAGPSSAASPTPVPAPVRSQQPSPRWEHPGQPQSQLPGYSSEQQAQSYHRAYYPPSTRYQDQPSHVPTTPVLPIRSQQPSPRQGHLGQRVPTQTFEPLSSVGLGQPQGQLPGYSSAQQAQSYHRAYYPPATRYQDQPSRVPTTPASPTAQQLQQELADAQQQIRGLTDRITALSLDAETAELEAREVEKEARRY